MDSNASKTKEGTPDGMAKYDDPDYYSPKWAKAAPKIWKPYLTSFTLFSDLPIEIRQAIWKWSLAARVVEVKFNVNHGFFSTNKPPVALSVCKDSRDAVKYLYPICFGTIIHEAAIAFNFSLDTLYLDADLAPEVVPFIYSWKGLEAENLQTLAIDRYLDEEMEEFGYGIAFEAIKTLRQTTRLMPALKKVLMVAKLDDYWHEHGLPEGSGEIKLMESLPYDLQRYIDEEWHMDDEDGASECHQLPNMDDVLEGFDAPSKSVVWGWRPTELPLQPHPWDELIGDSEGHTPIQMSENEGDDD
ncbi:uncharacterized protein LY89DRAFT_70362 [Mollisia scopiformis]|uniref:2EXR domain-containing protein n=1 Tax=Mollisia scopiformis TaxID=149040 RepID=A0A194XA77_MOLSC|nr:uncharacterized protein LY89DRAFT_70362 [Mollisia scopiformis]KUJ17044.1 hypothetical protein LY89DRAFT_70362 [Mollisia scopiformis]